MELDPLLLARIQFAFTISFHILFPSFTIGLSVATAPIGIEKVRAGWINQTDVPLLVYLGPEINVSLVDHPQWEVFARLQHRSGGYGWIGHIDGSNADVLGIRYKF